MGMHVKRHGWRYSAPAFLFGLMSIATLAAEQQSTATGVIEEVEVTGIRESLRDALSVKMNSDLVVDAIFSEDIGQLPGLQLRFQVNNLTDEPLRMHRDNESNRIGRYDEYGRRYLLDVTIKF
jgi:hypothetical protein